MSKLNFEGGPDPFKPIGNINFRDLLVDVIGRRPPDIGDGILLRAEPDPSGQAPDSLLMSGSGLRRVIQAREVVLA